MEVLACQVETIVESIYPFAWSILATGWILITSAWLWPMPEWGDDEQTTI